jgi:hypothetical protein
MNLPWGRVCSLAGDEEPASESNTIGLKLVAKD